MRAYRRRRRQGLVEADARVLRSRLAALQRGGRRNPQGSAQISTAAKHLLAKSGYSGEPIILMAAQDLAAHKAWGDVTFDLLHRLGINVDFVATDWGTVVARRAQKVSSRPGRLAPLPHRACTAWIRTDPSNKFLRANGEKAMFGWPSIPEVEAEIAAWYDAKSSLRSKAATRRLNRAALDHVVYAPLGFLSDAPSVAEERHGDSTGTAALFLGRRQGCLMAL